MKWFHSHLWKAVGEEPILLYGHKEPETTGPIATIYEQCLSCDERRLMYRWRRKLDWVHDGVMESDVRYATFVLSYGYQSYGY